MKSTIFICLLGVTLCMQAFADEWNSFKNQHGKQYSSLEDEILRKSIFTRNKKIIEDHNAQFEQGQTSYMMKMTHFGDMLPRELEKYKGAANMSDWMGTEKYTYSSQQVLPDFVDWRIQGAVTPVKNQAQCGSCYTFATTGVVEGQIWKKAGKLVSLSEQNIIDCSWEYRNCGCNGGSISNALVYIKKKGIASESSYSYEGNDEGECRYKPEDSVVNITKLWMIREGDEIALQHAVANIGPIATVIDSIQMMNFALYSKGIIDDANCKSDQPPHGVLVVGYGTENGTDYWIIKNSWGTVWGEDGYFRMARNKNRCRIPIFGMFPTVV